MNDEDYREHRFLYWLFFIPIGILVVICWVATKLHYPARIALMALVVSLIVGVPMIIPVFFVFLFHGWKMLGAVFAMWFIWLFAPSFLYLYFAEKENPHEISFHIPGA